MKLVENKFGHGAIKTNFLRKSLRRISRETVRAGEPFDWVKGYDARKTVGPITIKDQGTSSSCGGQAGSYFLEIQSKLRNGKDVVSAKSIYAPVAFKGGGTTINALETQIGAHGANLEASVPSYDVTGTPLSELKMTDKSFLTPETVKDAITRAGYLPINVHVDIESVAQAIRDYGGVLIEITGQNNGTWLSPTPLPPSKSNPSELWNHFMCGFGASMADQQQIDCLQSWGVDVGEQGIQHLQKAYFDSGYIREVFTFVYDTQIVPIDPNQDIWSAVVNWFRRLWGLTSSPRFA